MLFSKIKIIYQNNYIKALIPLFSLQKNCIIYQLRRYHDPVDTADTPPANANVIK
jgi:hypothetical protein